MFHQTAVDMPALRAWRLERVRAELRRRDYAGALLYDPVNIRYATDTSNMQIWTMHNAVRYAFVATEGPVVLFDFHNCEHLSAHSETVDEVRQAVSWSYFMVADRAPERAGVWADEIADLVKTHGGGNRRLAVDRLDGLGVRALEERQIELTEGQEVMEQARVVKNAVELAAMRESIAVCEEGLRRMTEALEPGITEAALWSILHQTNIELGGEWIETRLLASGPRTFPWFQECSQRVIQPGDLVCLDTDLVGPNSYCADISRSWIAGGRRPTAEQAWLLGHAEEQIAYNLDLVRPGLGFREFSEKCYRLPEESRRYRYSVVAHGVGLCDEYPAIYYEEDAAANAYDGVIEPGMCLCIESLVGREGGRESVKLEQQVVVTETGCELLSHFPLDYRL